MTIVDAYEKINEFLTTNHIIDLEKDYKTIVGASIDENEEKAALTCALEELEKTEVLKSTSLKNKKYWVLYRPLESFSQSLEINYLIAAGISSVINHVCEIVENEADKADATNITEKDIQNLIFIASKVSEENLKK
jgi:hypothetical protein